MIVTTDSVPVNFAPETEFEEIVQNVRTIITTYTFSVPLDRRFGISAEFLDSPVTDDGQARMQDELFTAIRKYEPRVEVNDISFEADPLTGYMKPVLDIEIKGGE